MNLLNLIVAACVVPAPLVAQVQISKVMAKDGFPIHQFGSAVAADDGWLIVGVIRDHQLAPSAGAAYSYQRVNGQWKFIDKFFGSDTHANDGFGYSTEIRGPTCAVGAIFADPNNVSAAGATYLLERFGMKWIETQKLVASPTIANANFGWSIAIDADRLVVGARSESSIGFNSGAAYVFERVGGVWSQTARLLANDGASFDFFGQSVAVHGDTIMVGSVADGPAGGSQGAAYVFEYNGIQWSQVAKLRASDPGVSAAFSSSIALQQDVALIASIAHKHGTLFNSGGVYVFERIGGVWQETQELLQHAPSNSLKFGSSVVIEGDLALIGAVRDPLNLTGRGAAYVFRREVAGWVEVGRMTANDANDSDLLGDRLAIDGNTVVAGVPARDDLCPTMPTCDSGAVYTFEFCPDARQFGWCISGAPCANPDKNAGCINSTGVGATLGAAGSSSVVFDDLRLEARKLQPDKSALFFMGAGVGQAPLGDGLRVVTPGTRGLHRFGILQSNAEGAALRANIISHSHSFPAAGRIQPGSVWNFQVWYRDPAGPCGSGANLTNAVEVLFRP